MSGIACRTTSSNHFLSCGIITLIALSGPHLPGRVLIEPVCKMVWRQPPLEGRVAEIDGIGCRGSAEGKWEGRETHKRVPIRYLRHNDTGRLGRKKGAKPPSHLCGTCFLASCLRKKAFFSDKWVNRWISKPDEAK